MKITLENTTKVVTLEVDGANVPARLWQGTDEHGTPVHAFITRIAPEVNPRDPASRPVLERFERSLEACAAPRPAVASIPLRLII